MTIAAVHLGRHHLHAGAARCRATAVAAMAEVSQGRTRNPNAWSLRIAVVSTSLEMSQAIGTSVRTSMCLHPPRAANLSERSAILPHHLHHRTMMTEISLPPGIHYLPHRLRHRTMMIAVAAEGTHLRQHLRHVGAVSRLAIAVEATVDLSPSLMLRLHAWVMDNVVASISLELSRVSGTFARTSMYMLLPLAVSL